MSTLSQDALRIFRAALKAADPVDAVLKHVKIATGILTVGRKRYRLNAFRNTYVVGAGKAGAAMAEAIERLFGEQICGGLINVKYGHVAGLRRIELNECGHPLPDRKGQLGAERIAQMVSDAGADDLVICLISGGASALLPLPVAPITLEEKQRTTNLLLNCGANIHEFNCVRKHISQLKGGQLARLTCPATMLTLILSDVIGDELDVIGSGPTAPDRSTFAEAKAILEKYAILDKVPPAVREEVMKSGPETPKPGDRVFAKVQNVIVGSNRLAVDRALAEADALGYRALVLSTFIEGETREVARVHAAIAKEMIATARPLKPPACIISGGETTVTIRGTGLGGRNQELALAAALDIAGLPKVTILSAGTDGTDGPTDAAGAIADGSTVGIAQARGLDPPTCLANNDSYRFFENVGGLIKTGPTRTNVADVRIILVR